jgi:FkbM family methyltransferase
LKQVCKVWLPDEEQEITKFLLAQQSKDGTGLYQYHKLTAALKYVKQFRVAVDIGAHCGLWAMQLEKRFQKVQCFEPIQRHRDCLALNAPNAFIYPYALGHKDGKVRLQKGVKSTGDTQIAPDGEYEAEIRTLDSFDLKDVDFVKIDAEGYELFILQGGEKLVDTYKPPMIVEQKPGKGKFYGLGDTDAVKWLEKKGYKVREVIAGDYIVAA